MTQSAPVDLMAFGLTEHQAMAYRAVFALQCATAREIASASGIPRNRAYEVLQSLQELDLVSVTLDKKQRFSANPIGPHLDRHLAGLRASLADLERLQGDLRDRYDLPREVEADPLGGKVQIRMVRGKRANLNVVAHFAARARQRVEALFDEATFRMHIASPDLLPALAALRARGGRVLLVAPLTQETRASFEEARAALGDAVVAMPASDAPLMTRILADGTLHFSPRAASGTAASSMVGLTTTHPAMVAEAEALLARWRSPDLVPDPLRSEALPHGRTA